MTEKNKKTRWLFPTNTNNFRMILAQGLITAPEGFSKYYQDVLSDYEGFLPLFKNKVPEDLIAKATSEADHLDPCLLELDVSGLSGQVDVFTKGMYISKPLDDLGVDSDDIENILIPLPLPLGCIKKVILKNKASIKTFKDDIKIRANTVLADIKLQSTVADSKLFVVSKKDSLPLQANSNFGTGDSAYLPEKQSIKPDYSSAYAYGGILALLFYNAKNGKESHDFFEWFSGCESILETDSQKKTIHRLVYDFFYGGIDESKPVNKMVAGIIECCLKKEDFKDSILDFLKDNSWGQELSDRKEMLAGTLQEYATNDSLSVSDRFNRAKTDIEKILLMLFTREDADSFIDYRNNKLEFSEYEYLLFSLFFGIKSGFTKVPQMIRRYNKLQTYISYKMAAYIHAKMDSSISFKSIKPPSTVWQFVGSNISKYIVKLLGLEHCVQTIMPRANFKHEKGKNVYEGYLEPKYEIITDKYFKELCNKKISDVLYNKIR